MKKIVSTLLAFLLVLGMCSFTVMADDSELLLESQSQNADEANGQISITVSTFEELRDAAKNAHDAPDIIYIASDIQLLDSIHLDRSVTLQSADGVGSATLTSNNQYHFISNTSSVPTISLTGLVLDGNNREGGILTQNVHLYLNDVTIQNCVNPDKEGGGISQTGGGRVDIQSSKLLNNSSREGGGIFMYGGGDLTIRDSEILSNSTSTRRSEGGGMSTGGVNVTIENSILNDNLGRNGGGAIYMTSGTLSVTDTELSNNVSYLTGGAIDASGTSIEIDGCSITNNSAELKGGGLNLWTQNSVIRNSTISGNASSKGYETAHGGGIYAGNSLLIEDCTITGNQSVLQDEYGDFSKGGGVYVTNPANLQIRGQTVIADNITLQSNNVWTEEMIAWQNDCIDDTVQWTQGYDYIYNCLDVWYMRAPEPSQTYVVTVNERYSDGAIADISTPHTIESGEPFEMDYSVPEGYTIDIQADGEIQIDQEARRISVAAVKQNIAITLTYSPISQQETHTVVITTRYADGALPESAETFDVPDGESFQHQLQVLDGYELVGFLQRSMPFVDWNTNMVTIDSVKEDFDLLFEFDRKQHTVSVTVRYLDGALEDSTETFDVLNGQPFHHQLDILDGYELVGFLQRSMPFVDWNTGEITIDSVEQDFDLLFELDRELDWNYHTVTVTVKYDDDTIADQISTYDVAHEDAFTVVFDVEPGYAPYGSQVDTGVGINMRSRTITFNNVNRELQATIYCR